MKIQRALVGFGHVVKAVDVLAGSPLVKKKTYRHYAANHGRAPEILIIETDDSEEATNPDRGEHHED